MGSIFTTRSLTFSPANRRVPSVRPNVSRVRRDAALTLASCSPHSNLVRTRLQAQGTPAHPQTYTGIRDAALKCYQREGWRGFYKGVSWAGLSSERVEG